MANEKDKSKYIRLISKASNRYGDRLLAMMDYYKVNNLWELTAEQAKEYYEREIEHGRSN